MRQESGRITAAGMTKQVSFKLEDNEAMNHRVDEAYRTKYKGSPYLDAMVSPRSRSATVKVTPRETKEASGKQRS